MTAPTTSIILDDDTLSRLQAIAEREGLSRHALMRRTLEELASEDASGTAGRQLSRSLLDLLRRRGWRAPGKQRETKDEQ